MKHHNQGGRVPKVGKIARDRPQSHCQGSHRKTKLQHMCRGPRKAHTASLIINSVSVSPFLPRLVDFVGFHVMPSMPLAPIILVLLLQTIERGLPNVWQWVSSSISIRFSLHLLQPSTNFSGLTLLSGGWDFL